MNAPIWYKDTEEWLLSKGTWFIAGGLIVLIAISSFLLIAVLYKKKYAIPAAAWITYMFMP